MVPMKPGPVNLLLEQMAQRCRKRGLALTMQRRAVFEALAGREDHPTADQVYDAVKVSLPAISRTTVYRILDTLVRNGLIVKVCHPGSAARFDPKVHRHHHLVCLSCERIVDIQAESLNHLSLPDVSGQGFHIEDYHVHFRGTCARCARKQKIGRRPSRAVGRPRAGSGPMMRNPRDKKRG